MILFSKQINIIIPLNFERKIIYLTSCSISAHICNKSDILELPLTATEFSSNNIRHTPRLIFRNRIMETPSSIFGSHFD
jgi:hypothetical protein